MSNRGQYSKRYSPKKSDVVRIINKTNDPVFFDEDGRLYGFLKKGELADHLRDTGVVDEELSYLMWVFLPGSEKLGTEVNYGGRKQSGDALSHVHDVQSEDSMLNFPMEEDVKSISDYRNKKYVGRFKIVQYPERRVKKKGKTDSVVVKLVTN